MAIEPARLTLRITGMRSKSRRKKPAAVGIALSLVAALGLAACGGGGTADAAASSTPVVSVKTVMGVKVFVNRHGKTLYSPNQERHGAIFCTGACTRIWVPVTFGGDPSRLSSIHTGLGTVPRPGGRRQVAFRDRPLYSFAPERAGQLTGDGVTDMFGSHRFSWRVVKLGGGSTGSPPPSGGGYPSPTPPGGYGYSGSGY